MPRLRLSKPTHLQNLVINTMRQIQELEQGKPYKYLGIEESTTSTNERKIEKGIQQDIKNVN